MTLSEVLLLHRQWNDRLSHPPEKANILQIEREHSLCWFKPGDLHWLKKEKKANIGIRSNSCQTKDIPPYEL